MRGLILKDLLGMKSYFKFFAIIIAICLIPAVTMGKGDFSTGFIGSFCTFIGGMLCFVSFAYDKAYGWDNYVLTLPYTRKQIVLGKYLFSLLIIGIGAGLGAAVNFVLTATGIAQMDAETWMVVALLGCAVILFVSITVPLMFRFGPEKARIIVILLFMVPFVLMAAFGDGDGGSRMDIVAAAMPLLPVISAAALVISWFCSIRAYVKQEA